MTLAEIISSKTAGGTGNLWSEIKSFFGGDVGDTSVSKPEKWVFFACRFIFHITAAIFTFYAPMKILPEPFMEVFPENGNTIAIVISLVFVFALEFFTYSIARRTTINCLKVWHEDFEASVFVNVLFGLLFSFAIGYFSYQCALAGSHNIIFQKTDKSGEITASKDVAVDILKSDYKGLVKSTTTMHDKSIRESENSLSNYQNRPNAKVWTDPKMITQLTNNISAARKAKSDDLAKIESAHKQDLLDEEGKATPLLEKNKEKQSMYQKYIPTVSLGVELGKFLFIFLLVQLAYKPTKKQAKQVQQVVDNTPQIIDIQKKTTIQTQPIPTVMPPLSNAVDNVDWVKQYGTLMSSRAVYKSKIKNTEKEGEFISATNSWLKNEPLLEEACKKLNRPYTKPQQPTNDRFKQTNP